MKITPKVSIILTSYNHEKYLHESIESVLNQTFTDFNLIIWDDASVDQSWNIIQSYKDSRIQAFRNEFNKRGIINTVLSSNISLGEYVAIHHSDDIWEPQKLEKQVAFLDSNPHIGAVFTWAKIIDEKGEPFEDQTHFYYKVFEQPNRSRYEWLNYFFYTGNALCHPSVLIRKSCYEDCGSYRYGFAQLTDFDMWVRLCLKYDIHVLPEKLTRFRVRANELNTSGNRPETRIRAQFEYLQILYNYLAIDDPYDFIRIFPKSAEYFKQDEYDIGFALGICALESEHNFSKLFGLRQLWEILNDERRTQKIIQLYGFSKLDFIKLTARHDIFSLIKTETLLNQTETLLNQTETLLTQTDQLTIQLNEQDVSIQDLATQVIEKDYIIQGLTTQANEIMSSNLWRILQQFVRIRLALIPYGSKRERFYYLLLKSFNILKTEGFFAFLKTLRRKLLSKDIISTTATLKLDHIKPDVSIVVPVFNSVEFTKNCIERIYKTKNQLSFEVIVVDNHSTDNTNQFLQIEHKRRSNFKIYRMPENLGFAGAVNYGCRQANGNYIVILNNDTLVTSGWLDKLIEPFLQDEMIGIVSPVTNYVGEGPQLDLEAAEIKPGNIEEYAEKIRNRGFIHEPSRLVFFCVVIKKEVLNIVGDLDIGYEKGNYEDDDYCMRTIIAGFKLAIARGAFVYHFGSMTFKNNKIAHNEFMEKNRKKFYEKAQNIASILRLPTFRTSEIIASVIVRTLNRPKLLQKALTSLSNQTFKSFEVVVVNDGGQNVSDLISTFEKYFAITYVHNPTSHGRASALNIGIVHSKGKWITFLDDDDIIYPWHLDTLIFNAQENTNSKFFYTDYNRCLFINQQDKYPQLTVGTEPWRYDPKKILIQNYIPIHTWLISRECFDKAGIFSENQLMLEDYEFLVRLSKVFNFYHIPRFTCEYRYYLDGVNSMILHRPKTLDALQHIYDQNPVDDPSVLRERKMQLMSLEHQIKEIKKLYSSLEEKSVDEVFIYRKIFGLVTGI